MNESVFRATRDFVYSFMKDGTAGNMKRQHYHDGYEIYLQFGGNRYVWFNNHRYSLKHGSMYIIEPFILHKTANADDSPCGRNLINFRRPMLETILNEREIGELFAKLKSCVIQWSDEQLAEISIHYDEIDKFWSRSCLDREKRCVKLAYMEVFKLIDKILYLSRDNKDIINLSSLEAVSNPEIYKVLKYIEEHYSENISADDMIEHLHVSRPTFYRSFKKVTGDTFISYLSRYRLSKAHMLTAETTLSLNEIAMRTGFSSAANMSRVFRQYYGVSPSHFRKFKFEKR